MTGPTIPMLTDELLRSALAVPPLTRAPRDLRDAIVDAVVATPQRPASFTQRLARRLPVLPPQARLLLAAAILALVLVTLAVVAGRLLGPPPGPFVQSLRGDATRTALMAGPGPVGQPFRLWDASLGGKVRGSPAVADGFAYLATESGQLVAVELATAEVTVIAELGASSRATPTITRDLIVVGTDAAELIAIRRTDRSVAWRSRVGGPIAGGPTVLGERIFVTTEGATLDAIAPDGTRAWRRPLPFGGWWSAGAGSVVIAQTDVGRYVAFDAGTGDLLWDQAAGPRASSGPMIIEALGLVLTTGRDDAFRNGTLVARDLVTGAERWRYEHPAARDVLAPAAGPAGIYVTGADGDVAILDPGAGRVLVRSTVAGPVNLGPTLVDELVIVARDDGWIVALDAATLAERWRWRVPGVPVSPAVAAGLVLVPTEDGVLHAIAGDGRTAPTPVATPESTLPPASLPPSPPAGERVADEAWTMTVASFGLGFTAVTVGPDGRVWLLGTDGDEIVEVDPTDGTEVQRIALDVELDLIQPDGDEFAPFAAVGDGGFVIADTDHQRIHRLDAAGRVVISWGRIGTGDGEFVSPFGIVVHESLVYVVDDNTCRVQSFTLDSRFVRAVGGDAVGGCTDTAVVADDGTVWLPTNNGVLGFSPDGQVTGRLGFANGQGLLLTRDPAGNRYLTDESGDLDRFTADGRHTDRWTGFGVTPAYVRADGATFSIDYDSGILRRIDLPPAG